LRIKKNQPVKKWFPETGYNPDSILGARRNFNGSQIMEIGEILKKFPETY
jgi:hypothetical protein